MSPLLTTHRPSDLSLGAACRIAVMGVVFAMVLSLALTPHADARPTGGTPAPESTR
ncbi:MAG: hypothetical protein AB7H96_07430 [Vicinamibacterales bacterium]